MRRVLALVMLVITGLPYWGGIVALTLGVRTMLFPAIVYQVSLLAQST
jgi:membrane protein insertase Oxa1/YidC/SpoIIIJ